jgi:hypothetical protein
MCYLYSCGKGPDICLPYFFLLLVNSSKNVSTYFSFGLNCSAVMGGVHEDVHAYLHASQV